MNITVITPQAGTAYVQPDKFATVCPIWFYSNVTHSQKLNARLYLNLEGWIDFAEGRIFQHEEETFTYEDFAEVNSLIQSI